MYSVAKVIDTNPESRNFLSCGVWVYNHADHALATILIGITKHDLIVEMAGCSPGPRTFDEVVGVLEARLHTAGKMPRLIYKERLANIESAEDFAVEHLWSNIDETSAMGVHEEFATILRACMHA